MKIRMDELIKTVAAALDIVENELLGASTNHGKRIAVLCSLMCKKLGMNDEEVKAVTTCALFHDNALTEYILSERPEGGEQEENFKLHCEYGQRNIDTLPFKTDVTGFVLYHHEEADGSGLFGLKEDEIPLGAAIIAAADAIDADYHLQRVTPEELPAIREYISSQSGKRFTKTAVDTVLAVLNEEALTALKDENICETAAHMLPPWEVPAEDYALIRLADLAAAIIDYKSNFTKKHSVQIANKVWLMGGHYGFDPSLRTRAYLAAALHDLGKLATPTDILEKPGKLDNEEFRIIKDHVRNTYELLKGITGFEDICEWASNHHEKLDGTGYSFGKNADELDFISRLMACTDIYQAVSEERPYHAGRSHEDTMVILWDMANKGQIDEKIVKDFDIVMAEYSFKDVPPPVESM
ncbi:MAG: HD domain-containing protein [Oscillospiraceae bacterium]|nr:HD domain-containing protein [Oscillospiraceae bacterium]